MTSNTNDQWQDSCKTLADRNAYLLNSKIWTDCSFALHSPGNPVKIIHAHGLILASASSVFAEMFYDKGNFFETRNYVINQNVEVFETLLKFIYTDIVNIKTLDEAINLYHEAEKYKLNRLKVECSKYIKSKLSPENVCETYKIAKSQGNKSVMDKCMQIIKTHTSEVLSSEGFCDLDITSVIEIFNLSTLNIPSETQLLRAAEKYCIKQSEKKPLMGPIESTSSVRSSEPSIVHAVQKIRFLTLSPQEFAADVSESILLTQSEAYVILLNILSPECKMSMPKGFSASRESRSRVKLNGSKHYSFLFRSEEQKLEAAIQIHVFVSSVIFCHSREKIDKVMERIIKWDRLVYSVHEDMDEVERNAILQKFYDNKKCTLIAPTILARSINMERVNCVFNYDLPSGKENYIHTVAGDFNSNTINFVRRKRGQIMKEIEDHYCIKIQEINMADNDIRQTMLNNFGVFINENEILMTIP